MEGRGEVSQTRHTKNNPKTKKQLGSGTTAVHQRFGGRVDSGVTTAIPRLQAAAQQATASKP